ncbi:hypothetical protein BDM02DRAFT_3115910 [Thelephora ganbajun]|uniref:Uncharacterized protein n=1 Tax=Thelephora ganbajun TaxID=370292 RepID=A0ACB6ZEF3_THEGA|nr:hypothetical protein BDM02DRAFT_3115910 [Thelephora ganbajun]
MWFNRPTYNSYTPYGYGYSSFEDPYARAVAQEHAARQREAAARCAEHHRRQQMQGAARSPYDSYLNDDTSISYPYNPRAHDYTTHEDLKRKQTLERQQQLESARQAKLDRREAERTRELAEHTSKLQKSTSTPVPRFSVSTLSPGRSPCAIPHTRPTQFSRYPSPSPSPNPVIPEVTPKQVRASMTIQEFYRTRMVRRQALVSIAELSTQFEQFKSAYSSPTRLDFCGATPDDTITIPVPSESFVHALSIPPSSRLEDATEASKYNPGLAFTSNNKVVHEYIENLNRLLDKLDRIESGGHASVREQRKQMIRNVEAEAQRMDRWIAAVWRLAQPRT